MKTTRLIGFLILVAFTLAVLAPAALAQAPAPEVKKEAPRTTSIKGKIDYMKDLGGYYVRGVEPGGEWMIVNQNAPVLKKLMKSKKTVTITGTLKGAEFLTIQTIDGKPYTGKAPAK
jgi:hypothetical protein